MSDAGSGADPAALHERTGGNPFFVTEVLATGTTDAPASVRDAVLARAAGIPEPARDVLGAAAVLGPGATLSLLAAVSRPRRGRRRRRACAADCWSPTR